MKTVYLLKNQSDEFKIGYTTRPVQKRIKELHTGSAYDIWLINEFHSPYAKKIETALQNVYSSYKTEGGGTEWFLLPLEEALRFLERCKKLEENFILLEKHSTLKPKLH